MALRRLLLSVLVVVMAVTSGVPLVAYAADDDILSVGLFPRRDAVVTMQIFKPLGDYLQQTLNRPVRLETARSFEDFMVRLRRGDFDLIHLNQYQYVAANKAQGYFAVARNEEFGRKDIRGGIYTHVESPVQRLSDLKGKVILFGGGVSAMMSHIYPRVMLARAGLFPGDYAARYSISPPNALIAAYLKQVDAAGAGDPVIGLPIVRDRIDTNDLRVIAMSDPLPQLPWAAHPDLDDTTVTAIARALLALNHSPDGKAVLKAARMTGIHPASDEDYGPVRAVIAEYEAIMAEHGAKEGQSQ